MFHKKNQGMKYHATQTGEPKPLDLSMAQRIDPKSLVPRTESQTIKNPTNSSFSLKNFNPLFSNPNIDESDDQSQTSVLQRITSDFSPSHSPRCQKDPSNINSCCKKLIIENKRLKMLVKS